MPLRTSHAAIAVPATGDPRRAYGRWHTPQTLVCWASITKLFVAAACRALVASGDLAWSDTVGDLTGRPSRLTVADLVLHRTGLPRMLPVQSRQWRDPYVAWTPARFDADALDLVDDLVDPATRGTPEYSNLGYAVLARALELGFERPWIDLVRRHVIQPLGVPGADVQVGAPTASGGALRPQGILGRALDDWDVSTGPFAGAGGLCSTVPAMAGLLRRSVEDGGPLAPGPGPHAWSDDGPRHVFQGALMYTGAIVVVDASTTAVAVAHTVGGLPGLGDRAARRALERLVPEGNHR